MLDKNRIEYILYKIHDFTYLERCCRSNLAGAAFVIRTSTKPAVALNR